MRHFCTYFDSNYLVRGLALYRSLARYARPFRLYVLCMDMITFDSLMRLNLPDVEPINLAEFERGDTSLAEAKKNRSAIEYYFTCTPSLLLFVLKRFRDVGLITYLDADLYFFGDPNPIFGELGANSILIVSHRLPEHLKLAETFGVYNVGLLSFRNDEHGRAALEWWRQRCLEWCYDHPEAGRFADQKYLDDWPERFSGVVVLQHKGANLAPWNVSGYRISRRQGTVRVDADALIFYHFHNLKVLSRHLFDLGLDVYGARLGVTLRQRVYLPYLRELQSLMELDSSEFTRSIRYGATTEPRVITGPLLLVVRGTAIPDERGLLASKWNRAAELEDKLAISEASHGRLWAERATLLSQLEVCEADRAARLQIIESQGAQLGHLLADRDRLRDQLEGVAGQLQVSEADRAARLQVIESQGAQLGHLLADRDRLRDQLEGVAGQLQVSEADRAARLQVIESQGAQLAHLHADWERLHTEQEMLLNQLQSSEADRAERLEVIHAQGAQLHAQGAQLHAQGAQLQAQGAQLQAQGAQLIALQQTLRTLASSRAYRLLRRLGYWKFLERALAEVPTNSAG